MKDYSLSPYELLPQFETEKGVVIGLFASPYVVLDRLYFAYLNRLDVSMVQISLMVLYASHGYSCYHKGVL